MTRSRSRCWSGAEGARAQLGAVSGWAARCATQVRDPSARPRCAQPGSAGGVRPPPTFSSPAKSRRGRQAQLWRIPKYKRFLLQSTAQSSFRRRRAASAAHLASMSCLDDWPSSVDPAGCNGANPAGDHRPRRWRAGCSCRTQLSRIPSYKRFLLQDQSFSAWRLRTEHVQYVVATKLHRTRCAPPCPARLSLASGGERRSAAASQRNAFCAKGLAHNAPQVPTNFGIGPPAGSC
jgi:hypothetical protein